MRERLLDLLDFRRLTTSTNLDTLFRGNSPPVAQHLQSTALPSSFVIRQPPPPLPQFRFNRMPIQQILIPGLDREIPLMHRMPFMGQPDFRIYEMNRRLQQWTQEVDNLWWDTFATEFFEDDATLTLAFYLEDGLKKYTIGRTLIPRYFRSLFEGGVSELFFILKHSKEICHNSTIILDCEQTSMVTHHTRPIFTKVLTEGRLVLEMTYDDLMRIRTWHFAIHHHYELIPRSIVAMRQQDPGVAEHLSMNVTRQGLTNYTLNFLRLCVILEPMQELMSRHKAYGLSPRDCLKTTLFQKWQRMVAPPEANRQSNKRKKRKSSSTGTTTNNCSTTTSAASTPCNSVANNGIPVNQRAKRVSPEAPMFNSILGDVMVVGEPTLMGGEFGDKDERLIARLENAQYDSSSDSNQLNQELGSTTNNGVNPTNRLEQMVSFDYISSNSPSNVGTCTTQQPSTCNNHLPIPSSSHNVYRYTSQSHSSTSSQSNIHKHTPPSPNSSVWSQQDVNNRNSTINNQQPNSSENYTDKSPKSTVD